MNRITSASIAVVLACLAACRTIHADPPTRAYTLVYLKTGPASDTLSPAERQPLFAGHFANMERLANERKLVVAGPFGAQRHDAALRGLFVLDTAKRDEARAWAETDPTTRAGVFVLEFHDFATEVPLVRFLEHELARLSLARAEGRTPKPGEGGRSYVILTAEQGPLARRELNQLGSAGGVILIAGLDGVRTFAVLDAKDLASARERFGALLERIGAHTLDEWFASGELVRLPAL